MPIVGVHQQLDSSTDLTKLPSRSGITPPRLKISDQDFEATTSGKDTLTNWLPIFSTAQVLSHLFYPRENWMSSSPKTAIETYGVTLTGLLRWQFTGTSKKPPFDSMRKSKMYAPTSTPLLSRISLITNGSHPNSLINRHLWRILMGKRLY